MAKMIFVVYSEYDRTDESSTVITKVLNANAAGKAEAEKLVDIHDDAIVILGEWCQVVKRHTEIVLPEGK